MCTSINSVADLRPRILPRILERLVIKDHIFHTIPRNTIKDQYGFKPTSNTTSAIINNVSVIHETNKYVHCLMIHFSKAVDSVDPITLNPKLRALNIVDNIIQ